MPGVDNTYQGREEKLRMVREESYGSLPGSPSWQDMPFRGDGVGLGGSREHFRPDLNVGAGDQADQVVVVHRETPDGALTTLPFPETAAFLLDAGLERDTDGDLFSYQAEHYTPTDPRRYTGLVVNTLTITVSGTGDGDVEFDLDWMGRSEEADDNISASDVDYESNITLVPFMYRDAALYLQGEQVSDIDEFTLTIENDLAEGPVVGDRRGYIEAQGRDISLELTKVHHNDGFRQAARDGLTVAFEAHFSHPVTGAIMNFEIPRLFVPSTEEDRTPSQLVKESPTMEAARDVEAGYDIKWAVDTGPTTTTWAEPTTTTDYFN